MMKNISDSVILWVNLLILFLLFLKFAAKPFINFLKGRKKKLTEEFEILEIQKERILGEINEIKKSIDEKQSILENAEENIIKQGEKKKSEIIKEAEHESNLILNKAKQKTENHILHETKKFYTETRSEIMSKNFCEADSKVSVNKSDNINENNN